VNRILALRKCSKTDPRLLEEIIERTFQNFEYVVTTTGYEKHGGINVVLEGPAKTTIGIHVRHYGGKIDVAQIKAFSGALVRNGCTQGVFIITSSSKEGARQASIKSRHRGDANILTNTKEFFEALGIGTRPLKQGARPAPMKQLHRGDAKILTNTKEFFEALGISNRRFYKSFEEWRAAVGFVRLHQYDEVRA